MTNHRFSVFILFFFFVLSCITANQQNFSQAAEPHINGTTALAFSIDGSVYSAGRDGFVIKWSDEGAQSYQFSDLMIKFFAVNPVNGDIALYETDGFSVHRVSVWNWANKTRKFIKTLSGEIMSLTYTARGTYIILGTVAIQGATFINAQNGAQSSLLGGNTGIVSFAFTNSAETSLVLYAATGTLTYYDLRTKKVRAAFQTETNLQGITLYKNNLILAGVKDNFVYTIDALSGQLLKKIPANDAILTVNSTDLFLTYIAKNTVGMYCKYVEDENGFTETETGNSVKITAAIKIGTGAYYGTVDGNVLFEPIYDSTLVALTQKTRKNVLDLCVSDETAYFLTEDSYYQANLSTSSVSRLASVSGFTSITRCPNGTILWAKGTRTPFTYIPDDNLFLRETLYTPSSTVQSLVIYDSRLLFVEGNGLTILYNLETRKVEGRYTGTGFQSAAMVNETVYVAKSAATNPKTPLININLKTGETVAEFKNSSGDVAYALTSDKNMLYGIMPRVSTGDRKTDIFAYNTQTHFLRTILTFADEDLDADMILHKTMLYTNLGKTQITVLDLSRNSTQRIPRSSVLPAKIIPSDQYILLLNKNGTVSVYKNKPYTLIANWAVMQNGECVVF